MIFDDEKLVAEGLIRLRVVGLSNFGYRHRPLPIVKRDHFKEHEKFDPASIDPAELEPGNIA